MEHTPGPWEVRLHDLDTDDGIVTDHCVSREGKVIADFMWSYVDEATQLANARLIAAAPELLEVLERIVDDWHILRMKDRLQAQAVIKKARGEA